MKANLNNLGDFWNYKHKPRIVQHEDFIDIGNPMLVLKLYNMVKSGQNFIDRKVLELVREFTRTEALGKRIDAFSGLGFAILSPEIFNVARWDQKIPYLLKNDVYEYEVQDGATIKARKLDTNVEGAFCAFELGIVNHEREAWNTYLASKREFKDKARYVNNRFVGIIK